MVEGATSVNWIDLSDDELVARLIGRGLPTDRAWTLVHERDWDGPAAEIDGILNS